MFLKPSLPSECISNVLTFLENETLYKCLFVNRHWCKLSVLKLWREPFKQKPNAVVIYTLLACLNEDEISSLIPCAINFNNQTSLFGYGKFIRKINHGYCVEHILTWFKSSCEGTSTTDGFDASQDCRVQKLVNVIYHIIMRQGSNLQEFDLRLSGDLPGCIDLPKKEIFKTYKPGIKNLRSINIGLDLRNDGMINYQNTIEFLRMVPKFCNGIVKCELRIYSLNRVFAKPLLDIIKLQPLKSSLIRIDDKDDDAKKIMYTFEFRSETLKRLVLERLNFQEIDLSFMSKLECLERLEIKYCNGFTLNFCKILIKKKLHLKELVLWFGIFYPLKVIKTVINSLCSETLLKLSFDIVTPETVKAIKESCPNITTLNIKIYSDEFLYLIIPLICELSSLRILNIEIADYIDRDLLVKFLGDHLIFVECLSLNFLINLPSFEYFTNNCKTNLKRLNILVDKCYRKDCLIYVNNFQKVKNSLKVLGIEDYENCFDWSNEELEVIDSLKNQGVGLTILNMNNLCIY